MAKLVLTSPADPNEFELVEINTLGRHPNNTIQILDRIISKEHAEVRRARDGRFILRDLGSLNGTFVHGQRVEQHTLRDGDEITVGSTQLVFRELPDPGDDQIPLQKVTIAPAMALSHIQQRIAARPDATFAPERQVTDQQQLRHDYERLRIAYELSRAVGNELDLDRLLHKILDNAFQMLRADRGVILLLNAEGQLLPRVARQRHGAPAEEIVISNSIIKEVVERRQAVLSSDASVDSRFSGAHSVIMQGIRSTMSVPLLHANELLGIMHLDSQIATNAFSEKDLQVFSSIAAQAAVSIQNARLVGKIEWEARTRAQFQRFFSPGMVQQLVEGRLKLDGVGEMRQVTTLFADIRGFTSMTEDADARDIVSVLNDYFEVMVEVLFRCNGTLDKYVGDEIMAVFGVPLAQPNAALDAVHCALEMMHALDEFNETRRAEKQPPIQIGIGINSGACVYGAIGSSKTLQYTVIGDAVNTASRLCSLAQAGEIVISDATARAAGPVLQLDAPQRVRVKNKAEELSVYRVRGLAPGARPGR